LTPKKISAAAGEETVFPDKTLKEIE